MPDTPIDIGFPDAPDLHLRIATGACKVRVAPAGTGADPQRWVTGTYRDPSGLRPTKVTVEGSTASITPDRPSLGWELVSKVPEYDLALGTAKPYRLSLDLGASVGVALSPHHGSTWRELVEGGDVAMYAAKSAGGGFEVFTPVRDAEGRGRVELLAQLREAIDDDQLVVHWQPIAAIESAGVEAAEALVRWEHPRHGLVYPDEFVPLAEQTELIGALTLRVLDRALEQCRRWHADGLRLRVSVNLSVHNLLDPEFPAQVSRLLRRWHVAPEWLKFEITEHTVMTDPIAAGRTLQELSAMGVRLAIDDFGTGYSSLVHLQQLPVDEIKIDKSFILGLGTAPGPGVTGIAPDGPLLPALIGFARRLGLRIVAEGVETPEAWDRLAVYGCDFAQGYYLSRPAAGPEFTRWLQRRLAESPSPSGAPVLRVVDGSGDDEPVAPQRRAAGA